MQAGGFAGVVARIGCAAAFALMLVGCRTLPIEAPVANTGSVDVALLMPPPGAARLELEASQGFAFPTLLEPVAMPDYPAELLMLRLPPLQLCAELDIGEDGRVFDARRRTDDTCSDDPGEPAQRLAALILDAVTQWHFRPATICTMPDAELVSDPCADERAVRRPTALRLSYLFYFSQHDGVPSVEMGAAR